MRKKVATKRRVVIKTVHFRANLAPDPNRDRFQHVHVEVIADVQTGMTARETLDGLKVFVKTELNRIIDGPPVEVPRRAGRFRANEPIQEDGWDYR